MTWEDADPHCKRRYEGEFVDGLFDGYGCMVWPDKYYDFKWVKGEMTKPEKIKMGKPKTK